MPFFLKGDKAIISYYKVERVYHPVLCVHLLRVIFNNVGGFGF